MADYLLYSMAETILRVLAQVAMDEYFLAMGLKSELQGLEDKLSTIKAVLLDAEEQQAMNRELRDWLGKLKYALTEAEDLLDEFQIEALHKKAAIENHATTKKVRKILGSPHSIKFQILMGHKLKCFHERLDKIAALRANFHLTERSMDRHTVHINSKMTHSFVRDGDVIGRNEDKENIIEMLISSSSDRCGRVSVIPIVGIAGLGKTALARLVYNDDKVMEYFQLRMWVCVSSGIEVENLAGMIITSATSRSYRESGIEQLQSKLRQTLRGQKFLLILDDVWDAEHRKWSELKNLLMDGAEGSKIIVTTRHRSVALVMETTHKYNLGGLSDTDCFSLFVKWAFPEGEDRKHPKLLEIGKAIVNKGQGVPSAVKTLGSLLYKKTDEKDWLKVRNSEIWEIRPQSEDDILPAMRLSYDLLPPHLKPCFAYCSMFPKGQHIDKDRLIQLWIAEGLVQSLDHGNCELEDAGNEYFDELCSRSLFQEVEENGPLHVTFRIENLLHDLAISVARTECLPAEFHPRGQDICKMVRHVSFCGCDYLSGNEVPEPMLELKKLRTIFFPRHGVRTLHDCFVDKCISTFLLLRVIDLADSFFEMLPNSIGYLKHLRYLDLSGNYKIKQLPKSICKLLNLQTLRLSDCEKLEKLPKYMGNLISLRHLYITTQQESFPGKEMGCLFFLQSLWITGCVNLVSLPEEIQHLASLRTLAISRCPRLESLPSCIGRLTNLQKLMINDCDELDFSEEITFEGLRFETLVIGDLPKLKALPQLSHRAAKSIHFLRITCCPNLEELSGWLSYSSSLHKLEILGCPKLSKLPKDFHKLTALKVLRIADCDMLIRRFKSSTAKDWEVIARVPEIYLDKTKIVFPSF